MHIVNGYRKEINYVYVFWLEECYLRKRTFNFEIFLFLLLLLLLLPVLGLFVCCPYNSSNHRFLGVQYSFYQWVSNVETFLLPLWFPLFYVEYP